MALSTKSRARRTGNILVGKRMLVESMRDQVELQVDVEVGCMEAGVGSEAFHEYMYII